MFVFIVTLLLAAFLGCDASSCPFSGKNQLSPNGLLYMAHMNPFSSEHNTRAYLLQFFADDVDFEVHSESVPVTGHGVDDVIKFNIPFFVEGSGAKLQAVDYIENADGSRASSVFLFSLTFPNGQHFQTYASHRLTWRDGRIAKLQLFADFSRIKAVYERELAVQSQ